jgi:hypothetical protein
MVEEHDNHFFLAQDKLIPIILYAIVTSVSIDNVCNVKIQAKFLKPTFTLQNSRQVHPFYWYCYLFFEHKLTLKDTTYTTTI